MVMSPPRPVSPPISPDDAPDTSRFFDLFADRKWGLLLSLAFLTLTVYGTSAVVFLTRTLLTGGPAQRDADLILVLNSLVSAFLSVGILRGFIPLQRALSRNWQKYAVLLGLTLLITLGLQRLLWNAALKNLLLHPSPAHFQANLFYLLSPLTAVGLYFTIWQRSTTFRRTISRQAYELVQLNHLKTQAELTALQARINPHFLYNTLNSISSLVYSNPAQADEMVVGLSKLFQAVTRSSGQLLASVREETSLITSYLELEQVRFGTRLSYTITLQPEIETAEIPRFLLQRLVENAVKHGVDGHLGAGEIGVDIRREGNQLQLIVTDTGEPFAARLLVGYGLTSISETLRLLYGDKASLTLQNTPRKQAIIQLPLGDD